MGFVNLKGKSFGVFGLKGTGKSNFLAYIMSMYPRHLVYDTLREHDKSNHYLPKFREFGDKAVAELKACVKKWVVRKDKAFLDLFVIDEISRYCPVHAGLPGCISDINDFCRHYPLSFGFSARRPAQINTNLTEMADYLFIFRLDGENDIKKLNATREGMGDMATTLQDFHYILYDRKEAKIMPPCPKMF